MCIRDRRLGIFTEATTRFTHNLDPEQCLPALLKAVELIKDLANGKISSDTIDIYTNKLEQKTIQITTSDANILLGTELETKQIKNLLENLEYTVKEKDSLYITPPSWRKDIEIKEDVYEDIGRIYGFNNIEHVLPLKRITPPRINRNLTTKNLIREILSNSGANETINYSFISDNNFNKCNLDSDLAYKIKNSLSPDLALMRTAVLQSLLQKSQDNLERGINSFTLYEIGIPHLLNFTEDNKLPVEKWHLSLSVSYTHLDVYKRQVYRYEKSGELHGLQRVRGFTQNDAHLFCTEEQLEELLIETLDLLHIFYQDIGFDKYKFRLSLSDWEHKPENYAGEKEKWDIAENTLRKVLDEKKLEYEEIPGDAAFYGPKIDVQAVNVFGKEDSISTIQLDFNFPERFDITYIDSEGEEKRPFIIHRALVGSFERFFSFLIEHHGGDFPLWYTPEQVYVIPISEKHKEYAGKIYDELKLAKIRVKIDERNKSMQSKIRDAEKLKIPYIVIVRCV